MKKWNKKIKLDCKRERHIFDTTMMRTWDSSLEFVPVCSRQLVKLPLFLVADELLFWLTNSNFGRNGRVARGGKTQHKFGDHPREQLPNIKKSKSRTCELQAPEKLHPRHVRRRSGRPDCSLAWIFVGHHQQYSSTLSRIGRSRTGNGSFVPHSRQLAPGRRSRTWELFYWLYSVILAL